MKSLVHTEELCSWSVPLERAPGAKSLVCIGLYKHNCGVKLRNITEKQIQLVQSETITRDTLTTWLPFIG